MVMSIIIMACSLYNHSQASRCTWETRTTHWIPTFIKEVPNNNLELPDLMAFAIVSKTAQSIWIGMCKLPYQLNNLLEMSHSSNLMSSRVNFKWTCSNQTTFKLSSHFLQSSRVWLIFQTSTMHKFTRLMRRAKVTFMERRLWLTRRKVTKTRPHLVIGTHSQRKRTWSMFPSSIKEMAGREKQRGTRVRSLSHRTR